MSAPLSLTLKDLAALVGGQLSFEGSGSQIIRGIASVNEATSEEITFLGNPKYLGALRRSSAGAALVPDDFREDVAAALVHVANPSLAFARLVAHFAPPPVPFLPGVHPSAVVAADAMLGRNVCIQPFAVIESGASIGDNSVIGAHCYIGRSARVGVDCLLHPRVTIADRCVVGDRAILHIGVVLGSDGFGFESDKGIHVKIPQVGIVQVDDDVEIGANTTVDRARFGRTWIKSGTKIDNLVQIAHNVVIGKQCLVIAQTGISGSTRLGDQVTVAGQSGIVGHIEIGDGAIVGARSGVTKNLPPNAVYMGNPAAPAAEYREEVAMIRRLPKLAQRVKNLESQSHPG